MSISLRLSMAQAHGKQVLPLRALLTKQARCRKCARNTQYTVSSYQANDEYEAQRVALNLPRNLHNTSDTQAAWTEGGSGTERRRQNLKRLTVGRHHQQRAKTRQPSLCSTRHFRADLT